MVATQISGSNVYRCHWLCAFVCMCVCAYVFVVVSRLIDYAFLLTT